MALQICTIVARNYVAHARVLAASFQAQHPGGRCHVLVIDDEDGAVRAEDEDFEIVPVAALELDEWDEMRAAYDVLEFSTAVKPWLLRYMLRSCDEGDGIAYFDPDIRVVSRMTELEAALSEHHLVLTPHLTEAMPRDGRKPSETDILVAGVFNLGFIGLGASQDAERLLDWWAERLLKDCRVAPHKGLFVDQRWVDFVPGLVADFDVLRHPGYNVAYWNLPTRTVALNGAGLTVNGEPLRFFHFSGFDPDVPSELSKHQNRISLPAVPVVAGLCDEYAASLRAAGYDRVRTIDYGHDRLPSGVRLTRELRTLYREGVEDGELTASVFTPSGEAELRAWLEEPSDEVAGLSRYLAKPWIDRGDVQAAYPDPGGEDWPEYLGWCHVYGPEQNGLDAALLPPLEGVEPGTPAVAPPRALGVNVAGYLRAELGVGEVARQMLTALDAAGIPALPVTASAPNSRQGHDFAGSGHEWNPFPVNLVCVNADGLPAFAERVGERFFDDRYTIGVWWWELSEFPERFDEAFAHVDELWVGSRFVAEAVAPRATVPVVPIRVPVGFPAPAPLAPGELGWPDGFTFLYSFDYNSVFRRKNPLGVVAAYTQAFGPGDGARLVLKSINHERDPHNHRLLTDAIAGRDDIVVIDAYVSSRDRNRLTATCDCYVSLHRSEGFGLTMAEAMFLGKPVIATGYSGNLEFMDEQSSYLVRHALVPVGGGADPYDATATWAEPDVGHAAALMREVFEDREGARRRGAVAARRMAERHSPIAAGQVVRARLDRVASRLETEPPASTELVVARDAARRHVADVMGAGPPGGSRLGGPGRLLRRALLRLLRPYTAYQDGVNRALADALRESDAALGALAQERVQLAEERAAHAEAAALAELRRQRRLLDELAERRGG
jgi:glycosyltransferase involved in cell wall biosynthesis